MKRAILVLGAESSGTRVVARVLMAAGCTARPNENNEVLSTCRPYDIADGPPPGDLIVWRRSLPNDGEWTTPEEMIGRFLRGYEVTVLETTREVPILIKSQLRAGHVKTREQAVEHITRAHFILARFPKLCVHYEDLVARPVAIQRWLWLTLGLPLVAPIDIYNGNQKYV